MGSVGYAGGCHGGGYGGGYGFGSGFAMLVVLFILLIIVGATFFHGSYQFTMQQVISTPIN